MKKLGALGMVFVGFVAGIFFVYSCGGGGGGNAIAEITDITGIITGLSGINSSIQGIDNSTDVSGIVTAINGISPTDVSGIVSELQNIDTALSNLTVNVIVGQKEILSESFTIKFDSGYAALWQPHTSSESFVITDVAIVNTGGVVARVSIGSFSSPGIGTSSESERWFSQSFASGIRFGPGEPVSISGNANNSTVFLSGYIVN